MDERTFDLTQPASRPVQVLWIVMGVCWIMSGLFSLRGDDFVGVLQIAFGLFALPAGFLMHRLNRYVIEFNDESLDRRTGVRHRKIPWEAISEIHVRFMKVELHLVGGRKEEINFGTMSYSANQVIKPRIISRLKAFAEARGIPVKEG
ncbi:MAG: hypothetical protein OXH50_21195 [Gemmatimonadetes bacterium]|nr:hypothetical protein [Gemmatimonadota bacterium]